MAQCLGNLWKNLSFNKGLIRELIFLGQGDKQNVSENMFRFFPQKNFGNLGAKTRKKSLLQNQLSSSKPKPFQKESDRFLNPH